MSHEHWEKWRKADCIERLRLTDDLLTRILNFVKSSVNDAQWHCVVSIVNSYFNDLEKELSSLWVYTGQHDLQIEVVIFLEKEKAQEYAQGQKRFFKKRLVYTVDQVTLRD